jgi:transposase-like protein
MNSYKRHRFPPDIISYAVWLYYRFNLSYAVTQLRSYGVAHRELMPDVIHDNSQYENNRAE